MNKYLTKTKRSGIFAFLIALVMVTVACSAAFAESTEGVAELVSEMTETPMPESAAQLIQHDLYQETVNNVEITIREAAYDGRSLFLEYVFRMLDVNEPLGITAAEAYGDELPEGMAPDQYVYGLAENAEDLLYSHNVGWWIDGIWIDGKPLSDMPGGSGQYTSGNSIPGEFVETDVWRLDNVDVYLNGKVQISLPIGDCQNLDDYTMDEHPEKYDEDGNLLLPEKGMITFEFDTKDVASSLRTFFPEGETVLPEVTAKVRETVFSPMLTYIKLDLEVNPDAMAAFIAENGEYALDDEGEPMWPYSGMDVFGEWIDSLELTDAAGTLLFPDSQGPAEYSNSDAEFLYPYIEEIPETLYLAPVNDEGTADMSRAIRLV